MWKARFEIIHPFTAALWIKQLFPNHSLTAVIPDENTRSPFTSVTQPLYFTVSFATLTYQLCCIWKTIVQQMRLLLHLGSCLEPGCSFWVFIHTYTTPIIRYSKWGWVALNFALTDYMHRFKPCSLAEKLFSAVVASPLGMHWRQQLQYLKALSTAEQSRFSKTKSEKRFWCWTESVCIPMRTEIVWYIS